MRYRFTIILFTSAFLFNYHPSFAYKKIYVDSANAQVQNGLNWISAFANLQDAINIAINGDTICVARGSYFPDLGMGFSDDDRTSTFTIPNGVYLAGGFIAGDNFSDRDPIINVTILSGDIDKDGDSLNNAYNIISLNNSGITIDGFTITGANALSNNTFGGAIQNVVNMDSLVTNFHLVQCIFLENYATSGAAISNYATSGAAINMTIEKCQFIDNYSESYGGAIYYEVTFGKISINIDSTSAINNQCNLIGGFLYKNIKSGGKITLKINDSDFSLNKAFAGGVMGSTIELGGNSTDSIIRCSMIKNKASGNGGCLHHSLQNPNDTLTLYISHSILDSNFAMNKGGAIYCQTDNGYLATHILSSEFSHDTSTSGGGALCLTGSNGNQKHHLEYCILMNNVAENGGGVLFSHNSINPSLFVMDSCKLNGNKVTENGGALEIQNSKGLIQFSGTDLQLLNNVAIKGGAVSIYSVNEADSTSCEFINCCFLKNTSSGGGGAVAINTSAEFGKGTILVDSCRIDSNITTIGNGGAIYSENAAESVKVKISNTHLNNNSASSGGAILIENHSNAKTYKLSMLNCELRGNQAKYDAGAFIMTNHVAFSTNEIEIDSSIFEANISNLNAGGIMLFTSGGNIFGKITNTTIKKNRALYYGAGIFIFSEGSKGSISQIIKSNSIYENRSQFGAGISIHCGGGTIDPSIIQCLFFQNMAEYNSAIDAYNYGGLINHKIIQCTITKNVADSSSALGIFDDGGTSCTIIRNSIISHNKNGTGFHSLDISGTNTYADTSLVDAENCDSLNAFFCGPGMIFNQPPLFTDVSNGNLSLLQYSPALDAGNNVTAINFGLTSDIQGNKRIQNSTIDLGAIEGSNTECINVLDLENLILSPINYRASNQILSAGQIMNNSTTILAAEDSINLIAGFEVNLGTELQVKIDGCP